jgi:hypothetical protein
MKYLEHTVETPWQYVQHPNLGVLLKHPDETLTTYKKKIDEILETCI